VVGPETGQCPRCEYLGWAYADELDGTTRRQIMNGAFARRGLLEPVRPAL
jgi:hypothetical protein